MTVEHWDAIVVGAGQGGLTCAGYLAASGLRVLVLEQHTVAGGNTQVFRRRGRYEFDVGTHYLGDCGPDGVLPRIYDGLGLAGRIVFREIDPDGFDRIVLPTVDLRVARGWDAYRDRLTAALPAEAAGIREVVDVCAAYHARQRTALLDPPTDRNSPMDLRSPPTLGTVMRRAGLSTRARVVFCAQAANYGLGPDQVSVWAHAAMMGDYLQGAYYPEGGGQMLGATLVEAIEGHGGELRTNSLVSAIEVERNRVVGVRLASGESVRAPVVVSNADYRRTILDLVGPAHLPPATVARAARASMALPLATLYLAIAEPAMRPLETNIWWHEHEDVDAVFAELALGGGAPPRFAFISSGSAKTGSSVPHHTVEVMTLCPAAFAPGRTGDAAALSHEYRTDGDYRDAKERLDASLFALAERALGPLAGQVLYRELSTPLTHIRFARSTGGTPYGIAATPQQFGLLRPAHATPLPGLFLVGASTVSGFGIVGVSVGGVRCAEVITGQSLLREVYAGKLIGDPARLPDRPPGWDPLSACRGSRAARHPSRAARR